MFHYPEAEQIVQCMDAGNRVEDDFERHHEWFGPVMVLLRGMPGSGKSTFAAELTYHAMLHKYSCKVASADHWFERLDGYVFEREELANAHANCEAVAEHAMRHQTHIVIIDNTNIPLKDFRCYLQLAERFGYRTQVIQFLCRDQQEALRLRDRSTSQPP